MVADDAVFVCHRSDLESGQVKAFDVDGTRVALVRIGDEFYAVDDTCSHEDYSLSQGEVWEDDCELECPQHGSTFDLRTGQACSLPATRPVAVHEVVVSGEDVAVRRA